MNKDYFLPSSLERHVRLPAATPLLASRNKNSGFTLIELVIYIAIFSMIAVTLVSLAYVSARKNQETTNNVIQAYENE
jgi:prepilin-type N-terminal cleavage/methylation domain-containing protein